MNITKETESQNYSALLFDELYSTISRHFQESARYPDLVFRGVWGFYYMKGAHSLKSYFFKSTDELLDDEILTDINDTLLDIDYGSLGAAFSDLFRPGQSCVKYLQNTFADPGGVVCYYDSLIGQEHAFFVLIKNGPEILGMLDIFFSGEFDRETFDRIRKGLEKLLGPGGNWLRPVINLFKIREHEELLNIQMDAIDNPLRNLLTPLQRAKQATEMIEKINLVSSLTPAFYIKDKNGQLVPELIGVNFQFINTQIKHELRFCPLTNENKSCYHFRDFHSFDEPDLICYNHFLKKYYFDIVRDLYARTYKVAFILPGDTYIQTTAYELSIVCHGEEYEHVASLLERIVSRVTEAGPIGQDIARFTERYPSSADTATLAKLQDELVFNFLDKEVRNGFNQQRGKKCDLDVMILYKNASGYLAYNHKKDCDGRNDYLRSISQPIKKYTSPTYLASLRAMPENQLETFSLCHCETLKQVAVDVAFYNPGLFVTHLKRKIAKNPGEYLDLLSRYVTTELHESPNTIEDELEFHFIGHNPLTNNPYTAAILGQFRLILGLLKGQEALLHARKAAISQVLARNMSHNHGSHVLSRMIHPKQLEAIERVFEGIRNILSQKTFERADHLKNLATELLPEDVADYNRLQKYHGRQVPDNLDLKKISQQIQYLSLFSHHQGLTHLEKNAYFNSYIKSRMDFLADIATSTPTMVNTKLLYAELIAGLDKNRILLDNISGIDNFRYSIEAFDCRMQHVNSRDMGSRPPRKRIQEDNDLSVAIPNDIIGQHAFYTILENLIRNTAKHSGMAEGKFVRFSVEIHEPDADAIRKCPKLNSYYEIHIFDSISFDEQTTYLDDTDAHFFYNNGLTSIDSREVAAGREIDRLEKIIYRQNIFIDQDLLDLKENKLRQGAWGMIEMEAAAAYLRKIPVESINEDKYKLNLPDLIGSHYGSYNDDVTAVNILKAFIKKTPEGDRHLAYRFFLMKPKELMVVIDQPMLNLVRSFNNNTLDLYKLSSRLIDHGIWLFFKGDMVPKGLDYFDEEAIYEHEMMLNMTFGQLERKTGVFPDRLVMMDFSKMFSTGFDKEDAYKLKNAAWQYYARSFPRIYIFESGREISDMNRDNPDVYAEFTHHGTVWPDIFAYFPSQRQHIEITTSLNNLASTLDKAETDTTYLFKLQDSINSQVIVLDERVQEAAEQLTYQPERRSGEKEPDPITFHQLYMATGILVPSKKDFDLSRLSYADKNKQLTPRAQLLQLLSEKTAGVAPRKRGETQFTRVNFLVMHLGVLEKVLSSEGPKAADPEEERHQISGLVADLRNALPNQGQNVKCIIISGRGLPSNLPADMPFVNYSAVSQYLIDSRNKYLLNDLLFSARKVFR